MVLVSPSAESSLGRLAERLLSWAEVSLQAGDLEQAEATAEEVRAVDPDNERAASILQRVAARRQGPWGERTLMTLLFSDLVGSTELSEQVEPERMHDLFAFYREAVAEAVSRYGGTLVSFYGDGVLAGFGYPEAHEDDARRAVLAGLDLVVAMHDGRAQLRRQIGAAADVRVGVHTGRVVITGVRGEVDVLSRNSILGVTPNLAARIQGVAEPGTVVVSDVTHQLVDADFFMRSVGEHQLRGITRSVEVFAVERPRYAAARFSADRYRRSGLVGREGPATRMLDAWDAMLQDPAAPGAAFLVAGEAGIGKSRLVVELIDRVQTRGGQVLGAAALPYYVNVPLWPLARMLERTLGLSQEGQADPATALEALEEHLTTVGLDPAGSVPLFAPLLRLPTTPAYPSLELDPAAQLELTMVRLVEWVTVLAARKPQLLVVEDLHWADPSTLDVLRRVAEQVPPSLLMVATTREAGSLPWLDSIQVLELERLDDSAAAQLVDNLSGDQELAEDFRTEIIGQADGNPLFIEELTRACLLTGPREPVPVRLQELFTSRLKAPGVDLRVVQVAATVGPVFWSSTVSEVIGDESAVEGQLSLLLQEGVIEPTPREGAYRFRHALMRDAAYETQVLDVRQQTHAALADVMAAAGAEPALLATHLDLAGLEVRAASCYVSAAMDSQASGAHTEATRLLSRALELYEEMPASAERDLGELQARMLRILSVSSMRGYAAPEVVADHDRAEELAEGMGRRPEVLPSIVAIYAYRLTHGETPIAREIADLLIAMTAEPEFAWFEPEVGGCAGYVHLYTGDLATAEEHFERSVSGFLAREPIGELVSPYWPLPNDPVAAAQIGLACIAALRGEIAEADRQQEEAIRRAEALGFPRGPFTVGFVKTYAAWIRQFLGDDEAARRLASDIVGVGVKHGYSYWVALGSAYLGGPLDEGPSAAFLQGTVDALRLMGHEAFLASLLSSLARMTAQAGDTARACELIDDALATAHRTGELVHVPEILRRRAELSIARGGATPEVVDDLTLAVSLATDQGSSVARLRSAVLLATLPEELRPAEWQETLAAARDAVPGSFTSPETETADRLLKR